MANKCKWRQPDSKGNFISLITALAYDEKAKGSLRETGKEEKGKTINSPSSLTLQEGMRISVQSTREDSQRN